MKDAIKYSIKFWLFAVILAPILIAVLNSSADLFLLFLVFGFIFSILSWVLITLIIYQVRKLKLKTSSKKIIITLFAIALCYIPFYLTFGPNDKDMSERFIYLYYMIPLVLGIWIFKMRIPPLNNSKSGSNSDTL